MKCVLIIPLVVFATSNFQAQSNLDEVFDHLDQQLEWIDQSGKQTVSSARCSKNIKRLVPNMENAEFSLRHQSSWKNGQCFKIYHLLSKDKENYRLFVQCKGENDDNFTVTRIKVLSI